MTKKYKEQLISINEIASLKKSVAVERICNFRDEVFEDIGACVRVQGSDYHAELGQASLRKAN